MSRFFEGHLALDLAAVLVVVFISVSVADIDDYDMHFRSMRTSVFNSAPASNATADFSPVPSDSEFDPDHRCACLLCTMTVSDSFGPRVLPPSAGKQPPLLVPALAGTLHLPEVFHPPSV